MRQLAEQVVAAVVTSPHPGRELESQICPQIGLELLGCGRYRRVYARTDSPFVVKIALLDWSFSETPDPNRLEFLRFGDWASPDLCPTWAYTGINDVSVAIAARASQEGAVDLAALADRFSRYVDHPIKALDIHARNCGTLETRAVLLDYGHGEVEEPD